MRAWFYVFSALWAALLAVLSAHFVLVHDVLTAALLALSIIVYATELVITAGAHVMRLMLVEQTTWNDVIAILIIVLSFIGLYIHVLNYDQVYALVILAMSLIIGKAVSSALQK
jgi:hypothetical protein